MERGFEKKRFETKKEAQQALADLLSAANKGDYFEPSIVLSGSTQKRSV
ncbi:Arm DNA-binding domain-containing protein [Brevibacillus brevis]|nr:Arm DNA-binding domain-containing protein [Brevibacillus brevis]WJQ79810.1 hypothetical protein QN310_20285 [Brevibacillus brevis]